MDVNHEPYDRGEPLGSAHNRAAKLTRDKIRAQRIVASWHQDEVVEVMERLGWEWTYDPYAQLIGRPGRRREWEWVGPRDPADPALSDRRADDRREVAKT